jgi:hypothetical protein
MLPALEKVPRVLSRDALGLLDAMRDPLGVRGLRAKLQPENDGPRRWRAGMTMRAADTSKVQLWIFGHGVHRGRFTFRLTAP